VFATIDVTKQEDCDRMIKTALDSFGDVDILYNNAGAGIRKKLHEHTDEEWNFVINTNLNAMFRGARAVLPHSSGRKTEISSPRLPPSDCSHRPSIPAIARPKPHYQSHARDGARLRSARNPHQLCVSRRHRDAAIPGFPPRPTLGEGMTEEQRKTMGASNKALLRMAGPKRSPMGSCS